MTRSLGAFAATLLAGSLSLHAQTARPLTIYSIDVEGGLSSLYIAPSGETMLIDTGSAGGRDTTRILEVMKAAGISNLDYLLTTHYDPDHVGGMKELTEKVKVGTFIDHGPRSGAGTFNDDYAAIIGTSKHLVPKPGDKLPIKGMDAIIVSSANQVITKPLPGAPGAGKPVPECADFWHREEADDDNANSVGTLFVLGKFRAINLGDLTWNTEVKLVCPVNLLGHVDLYQTSHHGLTRSGSPAFVHGLNPIVALMDNAATKGGNPSTYETLYSSPGLQDIWQLHWANGGGVEYNPPGQMIANMATPAEINEALVNPPDPNAGSRVTAGNRGATLTPFGGGGRGASGGGRGGSGGAGRGGGRGGPPPHTPAYWLKVTAQANGSFTVCNSRNNYCRTYQGGNH